VEGKDIMPPLSLPGNTDVSNDAADPTSWNKHPNTLIPNLVQFIEELLVILDVT
jgi:hypothetical protein